MNLSSIPTPTPCYKYFETPRVASTKDTLLHRSYLSMVDSQGFIPRYGPSLAVVQKREPSCEFVIRRGALLGYHIWPPCGLSLYRYIMMLVCCPAFVHSHSCNPNSRASPKSHSSWYFSKDFQERMLYHSLASAALGILIAAACLVKVLVGEVGDDGPAIQNERGFFSQRDQTITTDRADHRIRYCGAPQGSSACPRSADAPLALQLSRSLLAFLVAALVLPRFLRYR